MTQNQRALIRYWLIGLGMMITLLVIYFLIEDVDFRWFLFPALVLAVFVERLRPARPNEAPTPLHIIQNSRGWKLFLVAYGLSAVALAVASISMGGFDWLTDNPWLFALLILGPIIIPTILSQKAIFEALGNDRP